jgi:hypothetical protein
MATAIDFKALMREERARRVQASSAATAAAPALDLTRPALTDASRLAAGIDTMHYLDSWLTLEEAAALEGHLAAFPDWIALPHRRLGNLGGVPHPSGLMQEPLPPWLDPVITRLVASGVFPLPPNQVLMNAYDGPESGIGCANCAL